MVSLRGLGTVMDDSPKLKAPIRVGIDGRILMHYEMRGLARYTVEICGAMKEIAGDGIELYSFSPGAIAPEFLKRLDLTRVIFQARREMLWEHVELPRQLRRNRIEVFHATAERGLPYHRVCKYVLTRHDIIDRLPEYCGGENWRGRLRKKLSDFVSVRRADKFITVSNFSKEDICRYYGLAPERVLVTYNAAHPRFYEAVPAAKIIRVRKQYALPDRYFLFLGGFDFKKNVTMLVEAFARLSPDAPSLVLAGEHKWEFLSVFEKIRALGLPGRIVCPGLIADEDLPAIYQGALAFVHPSRYEGFGLQLVEAMASGVPVLASSTTSMPEVLDGSGLLFNPDDSLSIAEQMERVFRDSDLRETLIQKGRQRAQFFSWKKSAAQTLGLYSELLGRTGDLLNGNIEPLPVSRGQRG
ncbi:MAG: glycosyltransferase family 1 protein [Candidatus Acidiferrales bacterium]|jgi:glycosyltransferase involved in cell wall biosynthesis